MKILEKLPVTVLIAAKNEEVNIARCLASVTQAECVMVMDSESIDRTAEISRAHGAKVVKFHYQGCYPKKRQWALDHLTFDTPWILLLDADEIVPDRLWDEIRSAITSGNPADAYLITKGFHFLGRRFRYGGFSHAAVLLFRTGKARFERLFADSHSPDMEIHERLRVEGTIQRLRTPLIHEDFKGLESYIAKHNAYSTWEAALRHHYFQTGLWGYAGLRPTLFGNVQQRRRFLKLLSLHAPCEGLLWFLYHYFFRLGFMEGHPGLIASRLRANHFANVRAKVCELQRRSREPALSFQLSAASSDTRYPGSHSSDLDGSAPRI